MFPLILVHRKVYWRSCALMLMSRRLLEKHMRIRSFERLLQTQLVTLWRASNNRWTRRRWAYWSSNNISTRLWWPTSPIIMTVQVTGRKTGLPIMDSINREWKICHKTPDRLCNKWITHLLCLVHWAIQTTLMACFQLLIPSIWIRSHNRRRSNTTDDADDTLSVEAVLLLDQR